jgi:hypothetical protein
MPQGDLSQLMLMGIADDKIDTREQRDFFGSALRVASGHYNFCLGILSLNPANGRPGILISGGGYGTGIENDDRGLRGGDGAMEATLCELLF